MPGYVIGDGPTVEVEGSESGGDTTFTVADGDSIARAFVPEQVLTITGTTSTTVTVEGDWTAQQRVFLMTEPAFQRLLRVGIGQQATGLGITAPEAAGAVYMDSYAVANGVHNSGGGYTAFAYPGNPADVTAVILESGTVLPIASTAAGEVRVTGNYDGAPGYVGTAYGMSLTLPRPAVRREDGLAVLQEGLNYGRTVVSSAFGGFRITADGEVSSPDRTWTLPWTAKPSKLVATVRGLASKTRIKIDDAGAARPVRIVTAEIQGRRTRRII